MDCDMNIYDLKINRSAEVFGVDPQNVMISFKARRGERFTLSLFCKAGVLETYSLGLDDITSFYLDFPLKGGVEYRISVCSDCGDTAELDFVTAEPLGDRWLVTQKNCPVFRKAFTAPPAYGRAALTAAGLGLYAAFLNGRRVGSRFLTPGMNDYDDCVRYQTYDIAELLVPGENVLEVWLGNGWYKGRFGIDGHGGNTWGSEYCLNAALSFDGVQKIVTDESWQVSEGYVTDGGIYDGEHNSMFFHERKLDALEDLIEGANGKPVLVAYWFKHDLQRIQERFDVREIRTSADIADWNSGRIPVACIHPASAGHGLNLQAGGNTLIWFGLTWSLELYQQTNARLWRQGQRADTVVIHHIIAENTIDEQIMDALERKDTTQTALMNAVKAQLEV